MLLHLKCAVQNYEWGKRGGSSMVAQLMPKTEKIDENKPYAELWMGTHPNGPSIIVEEGKADKPLSEYISENPDECGHIKGGMQFLFKVLSVGKALSIQSHPNKEQARILHAKDPKNYPDANHKPEMAIALTDFELLCGFQRAHGILSNVKAHRELLELIGEDNLVELADEHGEQKQRAALKKIFTQVWTSSDDKVRHVIGEIVDRLNKKENRAPVDDLVLRLSKDFPNDIGILAPFFLNFFTLKPGQATFLGPNEPHAYLSGDCIECMALSDNTIRAGLTPKFKDGPTLCANLTYKMYDPPVFEPRQIAPGTLQYAPPVEEFVVHKLTNNVKWLAKEVNASILICIEGEAKLGGETMVRKGDVIFLPPAHSPTGQNLNLTMAAAEPSEDNNNGKKEFLAFRAFTPHRGCVNVYMGK